MARFPKPIETLIDELSALPGVGPKTAERYAFTLLKSTRPERDRLIRAIVAIDGEITACSLCRNYTESDPCAICSDTTRDRDAICVVANEQDLLAVESTSEHRGLYHILGGVLSPADGITPEELTVRELIQRIRKEGAVEIILAFDPTIEGESTILYLTRLLTPLEIRAHRDLVHGEIPEAPARPLADLSRGRTQGGDLPLELLHPRFELFSALHRVKK